MVQKEKAVFNNSYRFIDGDVVSAILDSNGKLSLKEGGLEVFESWRDYVKDVMGEKPTTGDEDAVTSQLGMVLGTSQVIEVVVSDKGRKPSPAANNNTKEEDPDMKNATAAAAKKAAPAKKAVTAAKEKAEVVQNPCVCGCGTMVNKNFAPGHDARVHGWAKKIARGDMKFSDIDTKDAARAVKFLKNEMSVKQGVKAAE